MKESFVKIPLINLKESIIEKYFEEVKESLIKLFVCRECETPVAFSAINLSEHLKEHTGSWNAYLENLADAINPYKQSKINTLQISTSLFDKTSSQQFSLRFPFSRITRYFENLDDSIHLQGLNACLQVQYNTCPVGQYAGPYDQNEMLPLSIQLPGTDLNFDRYTLFSHPDDVQCSQFIITQSYESLNDLSKIKSLEVGNAKGVDHDDTEKSNDLDEMTFYTCQKKICEIPCLCSVCYGEDQCHDHRIRHDELFDFEKDMVIIRSSDRFCEDHSFFDRSYLIKFPGIPKCCKICYKDYLHHICYHFNLHEKCKFCRKGRYKTYATTEEEFKHNLQKQEYYLKSVCPFCDSKFCEPHFRKKHIELEHENINRFTCDFCTKNFHSVQAKDYHTSVSHTYSEGGNAEMCSDCGQKFSAKVSLTRHIKFVHSENRNHTCPVCESTFKQKADMNVHMLNIHGFNMSKESYGNLETQERFTCQICNSTFKYKKGLNEHVRLIHEASEGSSTSKTYECDQCSTSFTMLKNLRAHKKLKHSGSCDEFQCKSCDSKFKQKKNLTRHEKMHKND